MTTKLTLLPKGHPTTHPMAAASHLLCLHNYKGWVEQKQLVSKQ